jgi:hypothetical protein
MLDWFNFGVNLGIKDVLWGDGAIQKPISFPALAPAAEKISFALNPSNHTYSPIFHWEPETLFSYTGFNPNGELISINFVKTV